MKLSDAKKKPILARHYLERYVNDGSPSGFTDLYRTSPNTDQFGLKPWFHLFICKAPKDWFVTFGEIPTWPSQEKNDWIFLHPDMQDKIKSMSEQLVVEVFEDPRVTPTASSRTVQFVGKRYHDYVKLHYDGTIGRVNRSLPYVKAISGPEISRELLTALDTRILPESLSIMPEVGARILRVPSCNQLGASQEIGMVWRLNKPHGPKAEHIHHIWPLFSLFSTDRLSPLDDYVLKQIIDVRKEHQDDFVLHKLIYPIVDCYFDLILKLGYQVECNAQNLMIGLNEEFDIVSIIIRDIGRFEKDITIRKSLDLPVEYESYPYKCISKEKELYQIRHSFAFDFKLNEYVITPIVNIVCDEYGSSSSVIERKIRDYIAHYLRLLPKDYFPDDGKWYKHERILLVQKRPYVQMPNPKYR